MAGSSEIDWTDMTWNPVRGCTKVSPGCKFCYAEAFAERFRGVAGHPYERGFDVRVVPGVLEQPLRWRKPRKVFVNSMSDLFHEDVPDAFIDRALAVMLLSPRHTFQVLTKRAERLPIYMQGAGVRVADVAAALAAKRGTALAASARAWPPRNLWLGVSVEDRRYGLPRLDALRRTPAALRFLSIEPLLEELGPVDLPGIGWVIVGGESGGRARECNLAWIRCVVEQCDEQSVPVFVKQMGARPVGVGAPIQLRRSKGNDPARMPADLAARRAFPEVSL
jgi:protein gp37